MKVLCVIPARWESSRYVGKPCTLIKGALGEHKALLLRVYEAARTAFPEPHDVIAAIDDKRVQALCEAHGIPYFMTDPALPTGTDRVAEAYTKTPIEAGYDVVVNWQGDSPLIPPTVAQQCAQAVHDHMGEVATPVVFLPDDAHRHLLNAGMNPVTVSREKDYAYYFSRSPLYSYTHKLGRHYLAHVGLYAMHPRALYLFSEREQANIERAEDLEQLRWLTMEIDGDPILVYPLTFRLSDLPLFDVNTPEDHERLERWMEEHGIR